MKRAIVKLRWSLLLQALQTDNIINVMIEKGLPEDSAIIGIRNNNFQYGDDVIEIVIESSELPEIGIGELIPEYDIVFRQLNFEYVKVSELAQNQN